MHSPDRPLVSSCVSWKLETKEVLLGPQESHVNMNDSNLCFLNRHSKPNFIAKIGFTALKKKNYSKVFPKIYSCHLRHSPRLMRKFSWYLKRSWAAGEKAAVAEQRPARLVSRKCPFSVSWSWSFPRSCGSDFRQGSAE